MRSKHVGTFGLRAKGGWLGGQAAAGPEPVGSTGAFPSPAPDTAAHGSNTTCQTAQGLSGSVPMTTLFLSLASFRPALPSSPEKPVTSLRARAPWLRHSPGSRSPREKGVTRNQHCEHFEPSLGPGPGHHLAHPSAPCPPHLLRTQSQTGGLMQTHSQGDTPRPPPPD